MYKRPVLLAAVSALSAVFAVLYGYRVLIAVPFCLIPVIFYRRKCKRAIILMISVFAVFLAGLFSALSSQRAYDEAGEQILSAENITLLGTVKRKERTSYGTRITVNLLGERNLRVSVLSDEEPALGTVVRIKGKPRAPEAQKNPGCFDEASYYRSLSIVSDIKDAKIESAGRDNFFIAGAYYRILEALYRLKYRMQDVFTAALPGEEGALLAALCIGIKNLLDPEVKVMF
ncbi:MAG: DUF4131 domain-containing protein, partial [Candidatus Weimeria sp.]